MVASRLLPGSTGQWPTMRTTIPRLSGVLIFLNSFTQRLWILPCMPWEDLLYRCKPCVAQDTARDFMALMLTHIL